MARKEVLGVLRDRLSRKDYCKLIRINNPRLHRFIAQYIELCRPDKVFVCADSIKDIEYIRQAAIRNGEEEKLAIAGHTIHFDSDSDQARAKGDTKFLLAKGVDLGPGIEAIDKDEGIREIRGLLKNIMQGHELYVLFSCLGPTNSEFSIPCIQITDSAYVAHNEILLYRRGYEEFKRLGERARFFKFVHSSGELDERKTSKNTNKRRIYIDREEETVYSVNTQYGGNSIGLKKLAMRLAIKRGSEEGWLTEHMLVMGIHGPAGRITYLTGAFPSLCGKTSTAMLEGESIVGDDIAFLRKENGEVRAVNVERGLFGIIQGINSKDDPIQWKTLHSPGEIIFSNVLVTEEGGVHWLGKDGKVPERGRNYSGEWWLGKKDAQGKEIPCSHPNARFTLGMDLLENLDPKLNDPQGVVIRGIVYGGRDSDTSLPVEESFNWVHGIITKGASLESETTAATLGKEGVRVSNPMSNIDFLSIPLARYIQNNLDFSRGFKFDFSRGFKTPPRIFSVNYFLRGREGTEKGKYLNEKNDKRVWYKWMELRVNGEVGAIRTPIGFLPRYEDLKRLFKEVLAKEYSPEEYRKQFTLRAPENLAKIERVIRIYKKVPDAPEILFKVLEEQRLRLIQASKDFGDYIPPEKFY